MTKRPSKAEQALLKKIDQAQENEAKWFKEGNRLKQLYIKTYKKQP